jgi:hypothetical protein
MRLGIISWLWLGCAVMCAGMVVDTTIMLFSMQGVEKAATNLSATALPLSAAASEMETNVMEVGLGVLKYLQRPDPVLKARIANDESNFKRALAKFRAIARQRNKIDLADRIEALFERYRQTAQDLVAKSDQRASTAAERHVALAALSELLKNDHGNLLALADMPVAATAFLNLIEDPSSPEYHATSSTGTGRDSTQESVPESPAAAASALVEMLRARLPARHTNWINALGSSLRVALERFHD